MIPPHNIVSIIIILLNGLYANEVSEKNVYEFQLPDDLKPEYYDLELYSDPLSHSRLLWGKVRIVVRNLSTKLPHFGTDVLISVYSNNFRYFVQKERT